MKRPRIRLPEGVHNRLPVDHAIHELDTKSLFEGMSVHRDDATHRLGRSLRQDPDLVPAGCVLVRVEESSLVAVLAKGEHCEIGHEVIPKGHDGELDIGLGIEGEHLHERRDTQRSKPRLLLAFAQDVDGPKVTLGDGDEDKISVQSVDADRLPVLVCKGPEPQEEFVLALARFKGVRDDALGKQNPKGVGKLAHVRRAG